MSALSQCFRPRLRDNSADPTDGSPSGGVVVRWTVDVSSSRPSSASDATAARVARCRSSAVRHCRPTGHCTWRHCRTAGHCTWRLVDKSCSGRESFNVASTSKTGQRRHLAVLPRTRTDHRRLLVCHAFLLVTRPQLRLPLCRPGA